MSVRVLRNNIIPGLDVGILCVAVVHLRKNSMKELKDKEEENVWLGGFVRGTRNRSHASH
jgi:hypothetical protein